jgi:chitinase
MIFLFHAYPAAGEAVGGNTGAVDYREPSGTIGANLNADIATCRARGQKILVSVGGSGGQVYITSQARADAFVASIKTINVGLGGSGTTLAFDGIDWNNFEGVQNNSQGTWMAYAGQQLRNYYGDNFIFTSPPAAFEYTTSGQAGVDRALLATLYAGGVLDWTCPQFYDPSDLNTLSNCRTALDFYNTAITVNGVSVQIPRDYIGVGFAIAATATNARWSTATASSAYTTLVSDGRAPKGAFNWANYEDTGDSFAANVAPVITNNTGGTPSPAFSLALSSQFTNGSATTAQLTAPSGKTSGADFQAGQMKESSNATTLDLVSGRYTEIEWNIIANTASVNAQQYEFRVTAGGTALDTYTVTPKWTIGTPVTPPPAPGVSARVTGLSSVTGLRTITI